MLEQRGRGGREKQRVGRGGVGCAGPGGLPGGLGIRPQVGGSSGGLWAEEGRAERSVLVRVRDEAGWTRWRAEALARGVKIWMDVAGRATSKDWK